MFDEFDVLSNVSNIKLYVCIINAIVDITFRVLEVESRDTLSFALYGYTAVSTYPPLSMDKL